jgi:hypothetical protein
MDNSLTPRPIPDRSPKQLYEMADLRRFEDAVREVVKEASTQAEEKALLLGMEAYSPSLAAQGIKALRPFLTREPTHEEHLYLIRYAPTGEAIMFIGEPTWPEGEYTNPSQIKVEVPYELVKAEDRPLLARSNNYY